MFDRQYPRNCLTIDPQEKEPEGARPGGRMPVRSKKARGTGVGPDGRPQPPLPPGCFYVDKFAKIGFDTLLRRRFHLYLHLPHFIQPPPRPPQA